TPVWALCCRHVGFRENTEVCNRHKVSNPNTDPPPRGSTPLLFFDRRRSVMAMTKLESLVLRVVPVVVRDVVAGLETIGTSQAMGQAPTVTLSFARHLSPGNPDADPNPRPRYEPANYGEMHAAQRAG